MKYLKFLTITSFLSVFTIGYFYQSTKNELNKTKSDFEVKEDSLFLEHQIELDRLNGIINSFSDSSNTELDSLKIVLKFEKKVFESFKIESNFKQQKLITQITRLQDDIIELKDSINNLKSEKIELLKNTDKKDKIIINKKKVIKNLEIKINSLKNEMDILNELNNIIIQQNIDTLQTSPIDIKEDNNKSKNKRKKNK